MFLKGIPNKKEVVSWAFFDFANSSYSLLIISLLFSVYFRDVIVGGGPNADLWWGIIVSVSILLGGLSAPFIGASADAAARRKPVFVFFVLVAVFGTASLYFTGPGTVVLASILFIITNYAFENAIVLYDSFLTVIAKPQHAGTVSGFAWGLGYLGGALAAILLLPLYRAGIDAPTVRFAFPLIALFFLVFALPAFLWVRDRGVAQAGAFVRHGFRRVMHTLSHVHEYKNVFLFFLAFYLLNDGLVTIFSFTGIFATTTLGLPLSAVFVLFLIVQAVGFIVTPLAGKVADRFGSKRVLLCAVAGWVVVTVWMSVVETPAMFYALAVLTGAVVGSSQAVGRSLLSLIVPLGKSTELFGFNALASKLSATLGPLVFGGVSAATGNQRLAVLSLLVFFVLSFIVFLFVKEERTEEVH
ncbi:MFS transporter [Candidatus Woesearchaeota archaeon]|nr:MFS transporter [Candidatus Woesearchaeota archaeon]